MTRIASINLHKGLRTAARRARLTNWLTSAAVDMVLAQEPSALDTDRWPTLDGYTLIEGNKRLGAWIREGLQPPPLSTPTEFVQRIDLGYAIAFNVYLNAYSREARAAQLRELTSILKAEMERPLVLLGDFNLAPSPDDGLVGTQQSHFNSDVDRVPLADLMLSQGLVDAMATEGRREFTIERALRGKLVKFRCDLALVSDAWTNEVKCSYDHSVRSGSRAFTDHSAIVVDAPVTINVAPDTIGNAQLCLGFDGAGSAGVGDAECKAHRTAMNRRSESPIARQVAGSLRTELHIRSILDYGCGHGQDVHYYRRHDIGADGFDPHPPFGWSKEPNGSYDLVTLVFVLNVIPDPVSRAHAVAAAADYVAPGGTLLLAARSSRDIETRAMKGRWPKHNDGFWSDKRRGMFQKGISHREMEQLAAQAGFTPYSTVQLPNPGPATTWALFHRLPSQVRPEERQGEIAARATGEKPNGSTG